MKVFETRRYLLHLIPRIAEKMAKNTTDGEPTLKVTAELVESACFSYGNGTAVGITFENLPKSFEREIGFDTRYESGIKSNFDGWCKEFFKSYYGENLEKVEEIK